MDRDTKRWIFDITVWMAGIFALVLLIGEAGAHGFEAHVATSTTPHAGPVDLQAPGPIRG